LEPTHRLPSSPGLAAPVEAGADGPAQDDVERPRRPSGSKQAGAARGGETLAKCCQRFRFVIVQIGKGDEPAQQRGAVVGAVGFRFTAQWQRDLMALVQVSAWLALLAFWVRGTAMGVRMRVSWRARRAQRAEAASAAAESAAESVVEVP